MNKRDIVRDYEFGRILVQKVGFHMLMTMKDGYRTAWKENNTPVTNLDFAISNMVIDEIRKVYPNDTVLGEEGSFMGNDEYTWVFDPVDGTQALEIVETTTCCLALLDNKGNTQFSFVYNPHNMKLFSAYIGKRSLLDGVDIKVSESKDLKSTYFFLSSRLNFEGIKSNGQIYDNLENVGAKLFNVRSLAFGCCMVALGKASGTLIGVETPFEIATTKLLVENAGGMVTDIYGNKIDRVDGKIQGALVSNGLVHEKLLEIIKK